MQRNTVQTTMNDCTCLESNEDIVNIDLELPDGCWKRRIFEENCAKEFVAFLDLPSYRIE